ncbi:MAG: hypothetical protein OSA94_05785 [Yoonia sp.]|nr:hypothetical protein [Yoonia sp.]
MMIKTAFIALAGISLMACTGTTEVSAPTPQLSDKDRFVSAIEANECVMNASNIGLIMSQASINRSQLATLTVALEDDGALAPDGTDSVRLSSINCI